mmetsp:Transcript_764/g.2555  ORF Transcript_764/g.2555 Transcript_764/m.2555 type:complete len:625 (-) Transcript_764:70-1944(-)
MNQQQPSNHLSHHTIALPKNSPLSRASHASCLSSNDSILIFGGEDILHKQMNDLMEVREVGQGEFICDVAGRTNFHDHHHAMHAMRDVDDNVNLSVNQKRNETLLGTRTHYASLLTDHNALESTQTFGYVSHNGESSWLSSSSSSFHCHHSRSLPLSKWHWRRIDVSSSGGDVANYTAGVGNAQQPPMDNMFYVRQEMRQVADLRRHQQQSYFECDGSGLAPQAPPDHIPVQRKFHQMVHDDSNRRLWLFAGESRVPDATSSTKYISLADLWEFDLEGRQWRQYQCFLTNVRSVMAQDNPDYCIKLKPLYGHTLNIIGQKLYCFGGCSEGGIMRPNEMTNRLCVLDLNSGLEYDDFTGEWLAKWRLVHTYVPRGRHSKGLLGAGASILESIFACENLHELDSTAMRDAPLTEATSEEKPIGRFGHTTNVWKNRFLVVLGGNERSDIWVYDTETEVWFEVEALNSKNIDLCESPTSSAMDDSGATVYHSSMNHDIPLGRKFHSSCMIHDDLYMFGGDCRTHLLDQVCNVFKFSLKTRRWSRIAPFNSFMHSPLPRVYHSMHHIYDRQRLTDCLVLMGGYEGVSCNVTRKIDVFELNSWNAKLRASLWHNVREYFCDCIVAVQHDD